MTNRKTVYYIVFNAPDGVYRQIGSECDTKKEAQKLADKWNANKSDNLYGVYEVASMQVIER